MSCLVLDGADVFLLRGDVCGDEVGVHGDDADEADEEEETRRGDLLSHGIGNIVLDSFLGDVSLVL